MLIGETGELGCRKIVPICPEQRYDYFAALPTKCQKQGRKNETIPAHSDGIWAETLGLDRWGQRETDTEVTK